LRLEWMGMIALRPLRSATPRGAVAWPTSTLGCSLARVSASSMRVRVVMSCSPRSGTIAELRCGWIWSSTPTGVPRSSGAFTGRRGEGDCSRREALRGGALYRGGGGLGTAGCTWSLRVRAAWHAPDGWSAGSGDGHSPPMAGEATGAGIVPYPNSDGQHPGTRPARLSLRKGRPVARGFARQFWSAASHRALRGCPGMLSRSGTGRRWSAERRSAGACATGSCYGLTGSGPPPALGPNRRNRGRRRARREPLRLVPS
jgi:hypothetical protein